MIAIHTSVKLETALNEPEAELFQTLISQEEILIVWPTLLETRMVLRARSFRMRERFPSCSLIFRT